METNGFIFSVNRDRTFSILPKTWLPTDNLNLIRIKSVGLCSSDYSRIYQNTAHKYPLTPGHEIYGVVEQSSKSYLFEEGDLVAIFPLLPCKKCKSCDNLDFQLCENYSYYGSRQDGGLATYLLAPDWNLKKISIDLERRIGNQVEPLSVVIHALKKFTLDVKEQKLLISGGGFLSFLALEAAKALGISEICITTTSDERQKFFSNLTNVVSSESLEPKRFNCLLDFSGNYRTFEELLPKISNKSEIVLVANRRDDTFISPHAWELILRKEITIRGSWNSTFLNSNEIDDWDIAIEYLETGQVRDLYPHSEVSFINLPNFLKSNPRMNGLNLGFPLVTRISVNV